MAGRDRRKVLDDESEGRKGLVPFGGGLLLRSPLTGFYRLQNNKNIIFSYISGLA